VLQAQRSMRTLMCADHDTRRSVSHHR
jgi:hypothetical protein